MNEFDEIKEWYERADAIIHDLSNDKIENILHLAAILRGIYVEGKKDGVKEWTSSPR